MAVVCLEPRVDVVWALADVGMASRAGVVGWLCCRGSEDNNVASRGFLLADKPLFARDWDDWDVKVGAVWVS